MCFKLYVNSKSSFGKPIDVDPSNSQLQPDASCSHADFSSIKYTTPLTTTSPFVDLHSDVGDGGVVFDQTRKTPEETLEPIIETVEILANDSPP